MVFNAGVLSNNVAELYIISANTWGDCISYLEGTGKKINAVSLVELQSIIINNPSSNECYFISLKNDVTNLIVNHVLIDTYQNSINWATQQSGFIINSFNRQTKTFISI